MWYSYLLALALWLIAASAPGALPLDDDSKPRPETTANHKERSESPARTKPSERHRDAPAPSFTPSEEVGADQAVDFPANI